jgi:hypothetical protein
VIVGDEVEAFALLLQGDVVADGTEVVAQMEFARGLHPGQNPLVGGHACSLPHEKRTLEI